MPSLQTASLVVAAAALLAGCAASPSGDKPAQTASKPARVCVPQTGTSVCRPDGSDGIANVKTTSGGDLGPDGMASTRK